MPYISIATKPDSIGVGRTARRASYRADSGADWVAEVDEVRPSEIEISEAAYLATAAANATYNAALPPAPAPARPLSPEDALVKAIMAASDIASLKVAITADPVLGPIAAKV
jgi:hypothetical protein